MKKIFVLLFGLAATSQVFAITACGVTNANLGVAGPGVLIAGAPGTFVLTDILPRCSQNVNLEYNQQGAIGFGVAANSVKGKYIFTGNTGGGSIAPGAICAPTCTAASLAVPLAAAVAAAT